MVRRPVKRQTNFSFDISHTTCERKQNNESGSLNELIALEMPPIGKY